MGLRDVAAADAAKILADAVTGFAFTAVLTNPAGVAVSVPVNANDISQAIDPETGVIISGRQATIAVSFEALTAAGVALPFGVVDTAGKPWRVSLADPFGTAYEFKIAQTNPDRTLGVITCMLEIYSP